MRLSLASRLLLSVTATLSLAGAPGVASAAASQQTLVDKATLAVQDMFVGVTPTSKIQRYLTQARAVLVCPSIFRMSIGIGGSGGGCLLLARDARGSWSDPAFYTLSSGSVGIQLGVQDSEAMFFVMTDRGLQALLDSQFKFGADASASFATMGSGIESGTTGRSNTDIMAVQKSKGLFAGAALGGSKLTTNSGANRSYYNQPVGPEDIVIAMRVNNPGADPLREILTRYGAQTAAAPLPAPSAGTAANAVDNTQPTALTPYTPPATGGVTSESLAAPTQTHR
ncbi:lipid-binding SYLF domain-containing protein [Acetobacter sacchari]|uniref:Lipid-binding SYLF domain-containing protein n=1 Tax=Acetobacter sacchari TaxID=2661687 RepID=A0ABS3LUI7_9PROT|nr:lipid-binding SYLF domain-containing protein [Acetobacter sacchari]MBO1359572.1 lipid-binding SYLF domain-containing protein [Acetobacter sacchari]